MSAESESTTEGSRFSFGTASVALALAVALFGTYLVQRHIDEVYGQYRSTEEVLYFEDGKLLKRLLIGYENIAADLYWLRAVQYFGGRRRDATNKNYDLLEPLLEIVTDLNPDLLIAYTYGATFLSEDFPAGSATPHKGIALIEKGMEAHPDHWRFYLDKGFVYFWYLKDHKKAAEVFQLGASIEGAPYWMISMAGRAATQGGDRTFAREMWQLVRENAQSEQIRANAEVHLEQLVVLDVMDRLETLVAKYKEARGRFPSNWGELTAAGYLQGIPRDPSGEAYLMDSTLGKVLISEESSLGAIVMRDQRKSQR